MPARVRGLSKLLGALDVATRESKKLVRDGLREAAAPVRDESERLLRELRPLPDKTARGYTIRLRKTGVVSVEQRLRKTTRLRPDWGATQMRDALVPALEDRGPEVVKRLSHQVDELANRVERA